MAEEDDAALLKAECAACPRWRIGRWATAPSPQAAGDEAVAGFRALGAARLLQRFQAEWA